MTSSEVALQIGRALWLTQINEIAQRATYAFLSELGIPFTPEFQAQIDHILRPLRGELR